MDVTRGLEEFPDRPHRPSTYAGPPSMTADEVQERLAAKGKLQAAVEDAVDTALLLHEQVVASLDFALASLWPVADNGQLAVQYLRLEAVRDSVKDLLLGAAGPLREGLDQQEIQG